MSEQVKDKVKIKLGGMTCASCAFKIETKLKKGARAFRTLFYFSCGLLLSFIIIICCPEGGAQRILITWC
jgi:hypothetical protein